MSNNEVVIEYHTTVVVIEDHNTEVVIEPVGAQGPAGPAGPPGTPGAPGGSRYHFEQVSPASTWVINHMLGYHPHVSLIYDGELGLADVVHNSLDQVSVIHGAPQAGEAELS